MKKSIKIISLIILFLGITGCGSKKNSNPKEEVIKEITNINLEIPFNEVSNIIIKTGENEKAQVKVGKTFNLILNITPNKLKNEKLNWKLSQKDIIEIDSKGTIKTLKKGNVSILAYDSKRKVKSNTLELEVIE